MARPTNKADLEKQAEEGFLKLMGLVEGGEK